MKRQLAHENHNRQDKALKPDYREEMGSRTQGTWSGISTTTRSAGKSTAGYVFTISLSFPEVKPLVAEGLRSFHVEIDLKRLLDAVKTEAGRHKSTLRTTTLKLRSGDLAKEKQKLLGQLAKTKVGRFMLWHDAVPEDGSATPPAIPQDYHDWLRKFVPK